MADGCCVSRARNGRPAIYVPWMLLETAAGPKTSGVGWCLRLLWVAVGSAAGLRGSAKWVIHQEKSDLLSAA